MIITGTSRYTDLIAIHRPPSGTRRRANDDRHLHSRVEHCTHTDWVPEQLAESVCSATVHFSSLDCPSPTPDEFLDFVSSPRRPLHSEVPP